MSDDFDFEPLPGLPEALPVGERIVWQGAPEWPELARRAFHADKLAAYFALLITVRLFFALSKGQPAAQALASYGMLLLAGSIAVGLVVGLAYLSARSTIYTITTKRVAMRFGIALPLTVNIPLSQIARADLALCRGRVGDISLEIERGNRIAYLVLWPHARAWYVNNPKPTLRGVRDADAVARVLAEAVAMLPAEPDKAVLLGDANIQPLPAAAQPSHLLEAAE